MLYSLIIHSYILILLLLTKPNTVQNINTCLAYWIFYKLKMLERFSFLYIDNKIILEYQINYLNVMFVGK